MTTSHYCLQLRPIALASGETIVLDDAPGVVIEGATPSLNELRLHCPTAFLTARARLFLDRDLICKLTTALRWA